MSEHRHDDGKTHECRQCPDCQQHGDDQSPRCHGHRICHYGPYGGLNRLHGADVMVVDEHRERHRADGQHQCSEQKSDAAADDDDPLLHYRQVRDEIRDFVMTLPESLY